MKFRMKSYTIGAAWTISRAAMSLLLLTAGVACMGIALAGCGTGFMPLQQQQQEPEESAANTQNTLYTIVDLGKVGMNLSDPGQPLIITNSGLISGGAGVGSAAGPPEHAVLWYGGKMIDIGNPGLGGNSFGYGINESGVESGEAEMVSGNLSTTEDFCGFETLGFSSSPTPCVPFVWRNGKMVALPTLGGVNGVATEINNYGAIGGYAETADLDPGCVTAGAAPQQYQFKPVVWSQGAAHPLPTGSDTDGIVYSINDSGQAVGASGSCAPFNPVSLWFFQPVHALLWNNGVATDLGSLGGAFNNIAHHVNNAGEVVGGSDLAGDQTSHAFLWTAATKMQDLGTIGDDVYSFALGINDGGVVTGLSINSDFSVIRAFIRRNGALVDLNTLTATNKDNLFLVTACSITSSGEIIGIALDSNGGEHGYLALPAHGATSASSAIKPVILPNRLRARLLQGLLR